MSNLNARMASFPEIEAATAERAFASPDSRIIRKFDENGPQELSNIELQNEFFAVAVLPGMERGPVLEMGDVPTVFS